METKKSFLESAALLLGLLILIFLCGRIDTKVHWMAQVQSEHSKMMQKILLQENVLNGLEHSTNRVHNRLDYNEQFLKKLTQLERKLDSRMSFAKFLLLTEARSVRLSATSPQGRIMRGAGSSLATFLVRANDDLPSHTLYIRLLTKDVNQPNNIRMMWRVVYDMPNVAMQATHDAAGEKLSEQHDIYSIPFLKMNKGELREISIVANTSALKSGDTIQVIILGSEAKGNVVSVE